ncbi:MAG: hypothetical protein KKG92_11780 [Gammaproteobacteria bacterium]|nr:hypothetical protein [Gammaproteobacteria bacterium]
MAATILSFPAPHKCLPGTLAFHPEFGLCEVTGASGAKRTVLYDERVPDLVPDTSDLEPDEDPESILSSATITIHEVEVDVNALREQDFPRDPMKQPLSRILGMNGRISLLSPRRPMDTRPHTPSPNHEQAIKMDMLHAPARCPIGALVHHPEYGICEVIDVDGVWRTIEYEVRESEFKASPENGAALAACLSFSAEDDESDWNESISAYEAVVHVDELRWLRSEVDLAKVGPRVLSMGKNRA